MGATAARSRADGAVRGLVWCGGGFWVGWSFRHRGKYKGVGYKNKGLLGGVRGFP